MKLKDAQIKDLIKELLSRADGFLIEVSLHDTMRIMAYLSNEKPQYRVDIENEWPVIFSDIDKAVEHLSTFWKNHDRDTTSKA
jgi:hypothetical protein